MYTFDSRIRYSETDSRGKLTLPALLNYFQDCSTFQSEDIGLGLRYMAEQGQVWVLNSWQIVVERYPDLGERVTIGTLPYEFRGFMGCRNFAMYGQDGECLAKANTVWSLLQVETGKPALPSEAMLKGYVLEEKLPMEYAGRKIPVPPGGELLEPITVREQHIDTNHHVNNGQYVVIAQALLPENFRIRQMRAEYKQQAFLGDVLYPYLVRGEESILISLRDREERPYATVEFTGGADKERE